MAEVKWVKVATDMFESSRKIKQIEMMPEGDTIIVIWIKLLLLAGSVNDGGAIYLTPEIPYTDEMLATELRRPLNTVKMALTIFERFGMIEVQDEVLHLASWEKYQNVEGMEKIREQTRARVADYRARKRKELAKGEECAYCGKHADTIDHIVPRSKGGEDVADNIVPCCKSCNSSKKDKDLADFLNDSYFFPYQGIDHERVRRNEKLMRFVNVDMKLNRYCNVTVTLGNAIEEEREEEKDIDKEREVEREKGASASSFPPSQEEVLEYAKEKGYSRQLASRFFAYYSTREWRTGAGRIVREWKTKLDRWAEEDEKKNESGVSGFDAEDAARIAIERSYGNGN